MSNPADVTPPTQGLVAGNYKLLRLIGKGGMGSVWEAQHHELNTRVAIKFIETEHAVSEEARSRFKKEAMAAASIQSKHAIQIFDHGVTGEGIPFIIMEMLQGESLERRVERLSRMSLQETARILLQVCRALQRAHERGIVHRDLKPDNVFIVRDADDGEEIAKVLDFGIAKVQGAPGNPGMTSSTKTGAVLGTPFYMSPEQARGLRNVDHRTDVWSLGVIAFRCVTGKLPFDGESVGDLLVKICTAPVPVPSQVVPGIPQGFDGWFMRTMEREPDRRFGSVMELANELCFVAGIAQPGQGAPVSHQQTVGVNAGLVTPHGMMASGVPGPHSSGQQANAARAASGYGHTPAALPNTQSSAGTSSPGMASQPGYAHQPASMTNSPFTTGVVAGVPSGGKGKVIGITVAVTLLFAGVGTGAFLKYRPKPSEPVVAGPANPSALPAGEKSELKAPAEEPKPADSAKTAAADTKPEKVADKPEATKPESTTPKAETTKVATKPGKPAPGPAPAPKPGPAAAPAPLPTPAPAPGPKPNKNDPGY